MQTDTKITAVSKERKTLRDFIPMVFAFFGGLLFWGLYQNVRLFTAGVLDGFLNKSLLLLWMHHLGFTALVSLFLAFLFNFLENWKPRIGLKATRIVFMVLLALEGFLVEYYVQNYDILGTGIVATLQSVGVRFSLFPLLLALPLILLVFFYLERHLIRLYRPLSRMYPFTIILFSLFLATLNSDKKPVNENKTQHLVASVIKDALDTPTYNGTDKYPLLKPYVKVPGLERYFDLGPRKPNLVFVIIEGLGADFVGKKATYPGFTPFLTSLQGQSLSWENFVSNTGESPAALPTIVGSLPFGKNGFSNAEAFVNRNTLYGILKRNGYFTSFNYGGNSALHHLDRFLDEERVDRILDRNDFGAIYAQQEEDAAGITLGYPDHALFNRGLALLETSDNPRMDVFLTQSTKSPDQVPNLEKYEAKVTTILENGPFAGRTRKLIKRNKEVFASFLYMDQALSHFMEGYQKRQDYSNTIFIITGTHNTTDLPHENEMGRYRVPFLLFSPLIRAPEKLTTIASHADILPALLSLLDSNYHFKIPKEVAWLGQGLTSGGTFEPSKKIPLYRGYGNIRDYIEGPYLYSDGSVHQLGEGLKLMGKIKDSVAERIADNFAYFKSVNQYVIQANALIPEELMVFSRPKSTFSKVDMVWIQSVFNGSDFDNAYDTARDLAHDGEWERALLLCSYILKEVPRHGDTEILMGRIHAWKKDYGNAIDILKEAVRKYPTYADGYAALLDAYFWGDQNREALLLSKKIQSNGITSPEVHEKLQRAREKMALDKTMPEAIIPENDLSQNLYNAP